MPSVREIRSIQAKELRVVRSDDGKQYLTGYAAKYNVLSSDLGYFRERIMPGTFTRAIAEKQDVRHLVNHDPNLVLGRTAAGTTELSEDSTGLAFKTLLGNRSYERDLAESVERGDVNECSFGMVVQKSRWLDDQTATDESMRNIRELLDVDLFDISSVTYPAYPQTNTQLSSRSLFPDGVPAEIRSHVRAVSAEECGCDCAECIDGNCDGCSNADCQDENCRCMERSLRKKADGEDLAADCFLVVGNPKEVNSWTLPWKFSTRNKTMAHLRNCLARFNQTIQGMEESAQSSAWSKLLSECRGHGISVTEGTPLASRLTTEQRNELRTGSGEADPMQRCQLAAYQCKINIEEIMQSIASGAEDRAAAVASCRQEFMEIARIAKEAADQCGTPDVDNAAEKQRAFIKSRLILASL